MPRLRRLSGLEVIALLESLGFVVVRVRGSYYRLRLSTSERSCFTTVPVHAKSPLPMGTLQAILRQVAACIPESDLRPLFYTDDDR